MLNSVATMSQDANAVCDHCGKPIERGQGVVFTMHRLPTLYWHARECYRLGVKPIDLKVFRKPQEG